ncbi:hypothetical protein [Microbacterium terregens]|jgi:hypothetical protein|uniref:MARVEL domain-containing protein n=1 Tax=Microbacterium terregens TaxID=69363 RepID=A0ABV5SVM5_9MICO
MQIARSGRFVFVAQWVAALLLPLFFFLGRGLVGAEVGWMGFVGMVYGLLVVVVLLLPPVLTLFDPTVRRAKATRLAYDIASVVLWAALIVGALTVPDAGDSGRLDSGLTAWTGGAVTYDASAVIFTAAAFITGIAYLAAVVLGIAGIVRWRRPVDA